MYGNRSKSLQSSRYIYTVAVDVVALDDDVAEIDAIIRAA